jgi:hypothetical protein
MPDYVETTLPALIFSPLSVPGDVDALGTLTVDNDAGSDWDGVMWAVEQNGRYAFTGSSGSGALLYDAESRTLLGGSTIVSTWVNNTSLTSNYQTILSTQASGGGAHLTHVGQFRVFVRASVPWFAGDVTIALAWGVGDMSRFTTNPGVTLRTDVNGAWTFVDLGYVTIPAGSTQWEGRILAKSTAVGDDVNIDWLMLFPADYGSGVASAIQPTIPASYVARDEFTGTTAGGTLNGRVAPAGGTWATSGDATDFSFVDSPQEAISRATISGTTGRFAILGTTTYTTVALSVDLVGATAFGVDGVKASLVARYVDGSNYLRAKTYRTFPGVGLPQRYVELEQVVAGVVTSLGLRFVGTTVEPPGRLELTVIADRAIVRWYVGDALIGEKEATSTALASGGALATGKVGVHDLHTLTGASTRVYDNVAVWVPAADAVPFAGRSVRVTSTGVERQNSAGTFYQPVASYIGGYLKVPPSGAEGRSVRFIVKPLYHPETSRGVRVDDRIDDLSATLSVTSRYLT